MEKLTQEPMFTSTIFDTQIQAAIRVGDWKLLTGDPGFSDLIPAPLDDYIKCKSYCTYLVCFYSMWSFFNASDH